MNKKSSLRLCVSAVLVVAAVALGCKNPPPTTVSLNTDQSHNITGEVTSQVTSNLNVGVQGSGNPSDGTWSAGIVVTFRQTPPTAGTVALLKAAGGVQTSALIWQLPQTKTVDPASAQFAAIKAALADGAVLTGFKY